MVQYVIEQRRIVELHLLVGEQHGQVELAKRGELVGCQPRPAQLAGRQISTERISAGRGKLAMRSSAAALCSPKVASTHAWRLARTRFTRSGR